MSAGEVEVFRLPDLGEGLTEGDVVEWLVSVGDRVEVDQPVARVETAKAVMDLPVPFAGTVTELHAGVGDTVSVGEALVSVAAGAPAAGAPEPGSGPVLVGSGTASEPRPSRGRHRRRGPGAPPGAGAPPGPPPVVSPVVRRLARDKGVALESLTGSGPGGLVTRQDVEAAVVPAPAKGGDDSELIPLSGARRAMAEKMALSRREIPEATVWVDVDATALLGARSEVAGAAPDVRVSVLCLLGRFCVAGLARHPELNSSYDPGRGAVIRHPRVNLGFAAQTERGLVVPVVHGADRLTTAGLAGELERLLAGAREGSLAPGDMQGGTFTVNNYGVYGVDGSAAIINHPEAAILGLGRIIDRPWVVDGALAVRKVAQLTLAFDHRVCDGGAAGAFLRFVADCVESPLSALAHL